MNYKTGLEDFIGKESLSKTLRKCIDSYREYKDPYGRDGGHP